MAELTRRSMVIQLAAMGLTVACTDKGEASGVSPGNGDDSGSPDDGGGADSGGTGGTGGTDSGGTGGTDSGGSDSGGADSGEPPFEPCEVEPATLDDPPSITKFHGKGPNYREGAPETTNLNVRGEVGFKLWVRGQVFDRAGNPLAGQRIDSWQVDQFGDYNLESDDYHGHGWQLTGEDGSYCFETIRPPVIYKDDGDAQTYAHIHFQCWLGDTEIENFQLAFDADPNLYTVNVPAEPDTVRAVEVTGEEEGVIRLDFVLDCSVDDA